MRNMNPSSVVCNNRERNFSNCIGSWFWKNHHSENIDFISSKLHSKYKFVELHALWVEVELKLVSLVKSHISNFQIIALDSKNVIFIAPSSGNEIIMVAYRSAQLHTNQKILHQSQTWLSIQTNRLWYIWSDGFTHNVGSW